MLGTHNSLTYAAPKHWWSRPFDFLAKCQDKDINAQLEAGVRYFDLRADSHVMAKHGLMKYGLSVYAAFNFLELYAETHPNENVCYRIVLEYSRKPFYSEYLTRQFEAKVQDILATYTALKFCGAFRKWDWLCVIEPAYKVSYVSAYSSFLGWRGFPYVPRLYAAWHNRNTLKDNKSVLDDNNKVLMMDFV